MKTFISLVSISVLLLFSSCKEKHSIRFANNYTETINSVVAGNASFGTINPGGVTGYVPVNAGNFQITGTSASGANLSGSGTVSGKGKHEWTITLNQQGVLSIQNDK
jgi:hypothetical protein